MHESILISIRKMLGIENEFTEFDSMIIPFINAAIARLTQLGVGPLSGFIISGEKETWNDLLGERNDLEQIKAYVMIKTKIAFDPPTSGSVLDSLENLALSYEYLINFTCEIGGDAHG